MATLTRRGWGRGQLPQSRLSKSKLLKNNAYFGPVMTFGIIAQVTLDSCNNSFLKVFEHSF